MFDFAWSELLVIGVVALIVIKPKDLPKVLRTVGYWVRQARQVASEFQTSIEQMAREAELSDVKKEIEDAGRKLTAEVQQTFDPVEIEKKFNPDTPTIAPPTTEIATAESTTTEMAAVETAATEPTPDEPTLPFLDPVAPPASAPAEPVPALEQAADKPGTHDRA